MLVDSWLTSLFVPDSLHKEVGVVSRDVLSFGMILWYIYTHCILMYCHLSFGETWQTYGEYNYFAWMYKYCAPWLNRLFSLIFAVQPFHWNTAASKRKNDCVILIMFMYYLLFGQNSYVTLELLSGLDIDYLDIVGHRWWNWPKFASPQSVEGISVSQSPLVGRAP